MLGGRVPLLIRAPQSITGGARFAVRELLTGGVGRYRVRGSELRVVLRHRTSDVFAFYEVFCQRVCDDLLRPLPALRGGTVRVVDLGAHVGLFSIRASAAFPNAHITAVEPDRRNLDVLRQAAALNASLADWELIEACAHVRSGSVDFVQGGSWASHVAGVGDPPARVQSDDRPDRVSVPTVDALELMDGADIVKMDIEGSEWAILSDPRIRDVRIGRLLVEYHPWAFPEGDTTRQVTGLMEQAGFQVLPMEEWSPERALVFATKP
jgi:FkbM family methyltransferase